MKRLNKLFAGILWVLTLASCETDMDEYQVEKPLSLEQQEMIDAYAPLMSYENNITLGAGIGLGEYNAQRVPFRLVNTNFNELTLTSGANHADFVSESGAVSAEPLVDLMALTKEKGITVYGSSLGWHENQNAEFLNTTIAPIVIPATGGPTWEARGSADFETADDSNYESSNADMYFTADGEGAGGAGRALRVENTEVKADDWGSQFFFTFDPATIVGEQYRLTMDVRADVAASYATQAHRAPGEYQHWNFFGTINVTTEWQPVELIITAVEGETAGVAAIAFNLGLTATNYYFDNIEVSQYKEEGGPTWDLQSGNDFETEDDINYQTTNALLSFSADGEGAGGSGRALIVENEEVRADDWRSQFFFVFEPQTEVGERYRLAMDVRADEAAAFATQAHRTPGDYQHWDFFGTINATTEWQHIEVEVTALEGETAGVASVAFNLGNTATKYYFDNLEIRWYNEEGAGETIVERTAQEKKDTLSYHLEQYMAAVIEASKENTLAWDVIKDPLDDANPQNLRSGFGVEELPEGEFYWQDYLGKDYGPTAFTIARKYANDGALLFISESNLESSSEKCEALIDFVEYIETNGGTVDGIATQMHIGLSTDKEAIDTMFELLAATGKQIKISELNVDLSVEPTVELLDLQAEMYQYVLDAYVTQVPAAQQYGVTIWEPVDLTVPIDEIAPVQGIWNTDYTRKPAYASLAEGLSAMD